VPFLAGMLGRVMFVLEDISRSCSKKQQIFVCFFRFWVSIFSTSDVGMINVFDNVTILDLLRSRIFADFVLLMHRWTAKCEFST